MTNRQRSIWIHALGAKAGGGLTYLDAVLPELFRQLAAGDVRVVLLLPNRPTKFSFPNWCDVRVMPLASRNWLTRLVFDQLILPLWLLRYRDAVLFCSGSFPPVLKPVRTTVLVRNAIYFEPDFLRRELPVRRALLKLQAVLIRVGARTCAAVYYPSRYMKTLVERTAPALERTGVLNYYGIRDAMLRARDRSASAPPKPTPTFLYVMNYTLQKNIGYLLEALALARDRQVNVQVIVTSSLSGGPRATSDRDHALIDDHDLVRSGYLLPIGPMFGSALVALYKQVDGCVFPSICESFGHPLVEAMAVGKPIICADRQYAREICGDQALYVDPRRPEDLVRIWERWPELAERHAPTDIAALTERFSWSKHVSTLLHSLLPERAV